MRRAGLTLAVALASSATVADAQTDTSGAIRTIDADSAVRTIDLKQSVIALERTRTRRNVVQISVSADVLFAFDRATLTDTARTTISGLAGRLRRSRGSVLVAGYTDSVGTTAYNRGLSRRRASAVAAVLRGALPNAGRLRAVGRGESDPVAPNTKGSHDNPAGRALNRRVTITARRR